MEAVVVLHPAAMVSLVVAVVRVLHQIVQVMRIAARVETDI